MSVSVATAGLAIGTHSGIVTLTGDGAETPTTHLVVTLVVSAPPSFLVSAVASPDSAGTITGTGSFARGSMATVAATTAAGFELVNWTRAGAPVATTSAYTFAVADNTTLVANFRRRVVTITTVAVPTAGGSTSGGAAFQYGAPVTVVATAVAGYGFTRWTEAGVVVSTSPSYSFVATGDRILTAEFAVTTRTTRSRQAPHPLQAEAC